MSHLQILHIAKNTADPRLWTRVFIEAINDVGALSLMESGGAMGEAERAAAIREADILITGWGNAPIPAGLADDPGNLKYICNLTGEMKAFLPAEVIASGIPVTNWGDLPAFPVAEGAVALLLATLKDIPRQVVHIQSGGWQLDADHTGGSIRGLKLGLYGLGVIGRAFVELVRPFGPSMVAFDPFVEELPDGVDRARSLRELFERSQAVVLHAGLTDQTRGSVDAQMLALLPDYGVVINTARGGVVDQDALFRELRSGRLRAGLDVLEPDELAPDDPARQLENCHFSAHRIWNGWPSGGKEPTDLNEMQRRCLANIDRFVRGVPLHDQLDTTRYARST